MRSIKQIVPAFKVNMGGIFIDQSLPFKGVDQIDPFLLIHHWKDNLTGGKQQRDVGVGPHPHRGFSPVTFIFKGGVHHRDSLGESAVIYEGGTQWMNSGSGLVHSERPAKELAEKGGEFEIIQFWINAPAKNKMDKPNYQPITKEETPVITSSEGKVTTYVVAGDFETEKGVINTYSPVLILRINMQSGGKKEIRVPKAFNALIYQLSGKVKINGTSVIEDKTMVHFNMDGEFITLEAQESSQLILLSGMPLEEKLSTYGPFVMNTEKEIKQAISDYQSGKMGILEEQFD